MSESLWPSTRSSQPDPTARDVDGEGHGVARPTRVAQERRGLHEVEDACGLMHRVLIASPWQRYQMDRDAAKPASDDDV